MAAAGNAPVVLCFGEILWDFLPDALYPGGAPFNVAYHLHRHGLDVRLVSAVGNDVLGDELRRRLAQWEIRDDFVSRHSDRPTGYVRARVGRGGDATYEIVENVAWDRIDVGSAATGIAAQARALVFGSLAQRSEHNRDSLRRLLSHLPIGALRIFDVNLRPPYDDLGIVRELATQATVLKLNAAEAARLAADEPETPGREEAHARALASAAGCRWVCVTAGDRGAGLLHEGEWTWESARPVEVIDTVGSGDAFLAALATGLLEGRSSGHDLLVRACRLGEWVASRRGATPLYDRSTPI